MVSNMRKGTNLLSSPLAVQSRESLSVAEYHLLQTQRTYVVVCTKLIDTPPPSQARYILQLIFSGIKRERLGITKCQAL